MYILKTLHWQFTILYSMIFSKLYLALSCLVRHVKHTQTVKCLYFVLKSQCLLKRLKSIQKSQSVESHLCHEDFLVSFLAERLDVGDGLSQQPCASRHAGDLLGRCKQHSPYRYIYLHINLCVCLSSFFLSWSLQKRVWVSFWKIRGWTTLNRFFECTKTLVDSII